MPNVLYDGWTLFRGPLSSPALHLLDILSNLPEGIAAHLAVPEAVPSAYPVRMPDGLAVHRIDTQDTPSGRLNWEQRILPRLAGRLGAAELREPITWLADHRNLDVRAAVARALGRHPGPESVEALRRLAEDKVWQVRAQAIQSLGKIGAPEHDLFARALRDPSWWVRLRGALALARTGAAGRDVLLTAEVGADVFARDMARLVLGLPPAALAEYQR